MHSVSREGKLRDIFREVLARPEAIALGITIAYFAVALVFGEFRYRINDDIGVAGSAREGFYVRYVGALLVHIIWFLTEITAWQLDWYAIILLIANAFAIFLVISAIRRLCHSPALFILLAGLVLALFIPYLFTLSFTFSAILLGCASIAYIYAISQEAGRPRFRHALMAGFAMALAVTIRIQGGEGAVVMGSGLGLALLVRCGLQGGKEDILKLVRLGLAFAAIPLSVVTADYLFKFNAPPEFHAYEVYDAERGKIHGKARMYRYVNDAEFLKEVGWEVRHAHQFKNWMFFDEEKFGLSYVRKFNELADERMLNRVTEEYLSTEGLGNRLSQIFSPNIQLVYLAALLILMLMVLSKKRIHVAAEVATIALLPFLALLYLAVFSKVPARVTGPLLAGWVFIFIAYFASVFQYFWQGRTRKLAAGLLLVLVVLTLAYREVSPLPGQFERMHNRQALIASQLETLNEHAEGMVVVAQPGRGLHEFTRDPFFLLDKQFHQVKLGWKTFSPNFYSQISRVGASSGSEFMSKIALCDDVRILSSIGWAEVLASYISEKTGMRVTIERDGGLNSKIGLFNLVAEGHETMNCQEQVAGNSRDDVR